MASAKDEKWNKILISIAFPSVIILIILSLTGIITLPRGMTFVGIAVVLFAVFATYNSAKKKRQK